MGRILRLNLPELDWDLHESEAALTGNSMVAEAKVPAAEAGLKPPRRRRAEQPA
jgi:hypothetical protein